MDMSIEMTPDPQDQAMEWEPQRRMTLNAARRRSGVVKMLRITFILLAILIVGIVIAYIINSARQVEPEPIVPVVTPGETDPIAGNEADDDVVMINPTFTGHDDAGRPYVVIANSAVRSQDGEDITNLVFPQLDMNPDQEDGSKVKAEEGIYDAKNRVLDLHQKVHLDSPNGYTYDSSHARFLIAEDRIIGDEPVSGDGPMGTIRANSFEIANGGGNVYFRGNVKTKIRGANDTPKDSQGE
jgi:lipopolysaccharide export system protein LptC